MNRSADRLYELLPVVYRLRDAERGEPLRALLQVIAEQVNLVEADIAQMYDNWFIETCEDWVVPYIADLIGYELLRTSGEPGEVVSQAARERSRILTPRRDVANVIHYRRRKGALALLELLARDAGGYGAARAVEFYKLLGWTQALNFQRPKRARTVDLGDGDALDLLGSPFDSAARTVDLRRVSSNREPGRFNIPGVGVFIWRLKTYGVTRTPAYCVEELAPECYSFSVLGHDTPLYNDPQIETEPTQIAGELNLPTPIRRRAFEKRIVKDGALVRTEASEKYYDRSLAIYLLDKKGELKMIPRETIIPANLSDWEKYRPAHGRVAVDPKRGRIIFPPDQKPRYGVVVSYNYAFSADIGGGEYDRPLSQPEDAVAFCVGKGEQYATINGALAAWEKAKTAVSIVADAVSGADAQEAARAAREKAKDFAAEPEKTAADIAAAAAEAAVNAEGASVDSVRAVVRRQLRAAVIEIRDSGVYTEPLKIELKADESLQIRAANGKRPVIRLLDYQASLPDALTVKGARGSRFALDGLLIAGRSVQIIGPDSAPAGDGDGDHKQDDDYEIEPPGEAAADEASETGETGDLCMVAIRHCTLVPGWSVDCDCEPQRPNDASLELDYTNATIKIEHSILGAIVVEADERAREPQVISITDSIWDATSEKRLALVANGGGLAYVKLTVARTTVIGKVKTHAISLAENSIFQGVVTVGRRQQGCVRFCYIVPGSRTPRRYNCQPDLAQQKVEAKLRKDAQEILADAREKGLPPPFTPADVEAAIDEAKTNERVRVEPQFNSERYGTPTYCQLAQTCADEIKRGADDESEMGAFHDLYQPQRGTNLRARLDEYTPAGADVGIIYTN